MSLVRHLHETFLPSERNHYRPHALSKRVLPLYGTLLVSLKLLTLFSVDAIPVGHAYSSAVTLENVIQLTNASRQSYNLQALNENTQLDQAAQAKANDMLQYQYFAHTSPQGKTPWDFIEAAKYNYIIAGENLAINYYSSEGVEQAWMNSPEHKANILNSNFEDIGVGISQGNYNGSPAIFVVQMFGTALVQPYVAKTSNLSPNADITTQTVAQKPATAPVQLAANTSLSKTLEVPVIENPEQYLIKGYTAEIKGQSSLPYVYVYVNGVMQSKVATSSGTFDAQITLSPGENNITAASYNGQQISAQSQAVSMGTAATAPQILGTELIPAPQASGNVSGTAYELQVQTLPDETSVVALYNGSQGIMLQPTNSPGQWQAILPSQINSAITIEAYDMAGNTVSSGQISIGDSLIDNYAFAVPSATNQINVLGHNLPASYANDFYIYFSIFLLIMLGAWISTRVKTMEVSAIAEISSLVLLAVLFWGH